MKSIKFIALLFLSFNSIVAQELISYDTTIEQAEEYFESEEYTKASESYKKAFKIVYENVVTSDVRFDAALAFSLSNDQKSAYKQLSKISNKGLFDAYTNYDNIVNEEGFESLRSEKKWKRLVQKIKIKEGIAKSKINAQLIESLKELLKKDQKVREEFTETLQKYGDQSEEFKKYGIKVNEVDSLNFIEFEVIIEKHGWPGPEVIGEEGVNTLFMLVQHNNNVDIQKKYLPFIKKAVNDGKEYPTDLALLEDRIAMYSNEMQTYGTQIRSDENKILYVWPIKNPEDVNKRRLRIGLDPLETYLKRFGIVWNLEKHKEKTIKSVSRMKK